MLVDRDPGAPSGFLQSDEDLAESIGDVLRSFWPNPRTGVVVTEGMVTVRGRVERRSTAAMLPRFVQMVPGVVAVEAHIDWSIDDGEIEAPSPDLLGPYEP